MNLFKDDYRKQFDDVSPSPALEQETLALMAEAQAHGAAIAPPKKSKKPLILSLSLSGAAALVAITVGLSFWLHRPEDIDPDKAGDINSVLAGNSSIQSDKSESGDASAPEDEEIKGDAAPEPGEEEDPTDTSGSADDALPENENAASGAPAPEDENADNDEKTEEESVENQATPVDPLAPVVIEDKNTETYLSIQAYLDALTAKKAIGYNKNYMADPALVIVPSYLPQKVQFRHLHAKSNGAYSYSYLLTDGENQYFMDISVPATFPRTLRDVHLRVRGTKGEYEGMDKVENKRIYYFGLYEEVTLTLTAVNGTAPTLEETDRILFDLLLDRYTVQNTLVQLTYK